MKTNGDLTIHPTGDHNNIEPHGGISLREYFAAMAMQGFCANPDKSINGTEAIKLSIWCADELIRNLNK